MESTIKTIGDYKNQLIATLLSSTDICELLLNKKGITEEEVDDLVYSQIFPYLYTDDTKTDVEAYICMEISIPRLSDSVATAQLTIWAYSHKENMRYYRTGYSGTCVDILADMIDRKLNNSLEYGINGLRLDAMTEIIPQRKYYGRKLVYTIFDFRLKKVREIS